MNRISRPQNPITGTRRAISIVTATIMTALFVLGSQSAAQAAYYNGCNTNFTIQTCLYDGHLSNGDVHIQGSFYNSSSKSITLTNVNLESTKFGDWEIHKANVVVKSKATYVVQKNMSANSWKGGVIASWAYSSDCSGCQGGIQKDNWTW